MKLTAFVFIFLFATDAFSSVLTIQKDFSISNPNLKSSFNLIQQLNSFTLVEKVDAKNKISVLAVKAKAPTLANKVTISKIWEENKPDYKIIKDNGCQKINGAHFECSRLVSKKSKYQAQRLIWVGKKDMIYLMVDHVNDSLMAAKYANDFKVME